MRIATALWGFRFMDMTQVIDACDRLGIPGIEGHLHPEVPKHFRADMTDAEVKSIFDYAASKNISFVSLATANDFSVSKDELPRHIDWIKTVIDFCATNKIPVIRVFAGWIDPAQLTDKILDQIGEAFDETCAYAAPKGVSLAVENHGGITAMAEDIQKIFDRVKADNFGLNYDPANFLYHGEDPVRALDMLKERVIYAHLKDVKIVDSKNEYCSVGDGVIDWKTMLPTLEKFYHGPCAIEYEEADDIIEGTERSVKFLKELVPFE